MLSEISIGCAGIHRMPASSPLASELTKIRSEELRQQALETDSTPRVVIVELKLPRVAVELLPSHMDARGIGARWQVRADGADSPDVEEQIADMRKAIKKITGKPPERFFSSSGAFVVTANGRQLQELAKLPAVSAIWPNNPKATKPR